MAPTPSVSPVVVDGYVFPPAAKSPGSASTFFLAGAGVRGLEIQGKFVNFTAIAVYLEDNALPTLAVKWNGKNVEGLADSVDFFRSIVTGPFEKLTRVKMILPLSGPQYTAKVTENAIAYWKTIGSYTEAEEKAVEEFHRVFKDKIFQPGSSIFFTQSKLGSLSIRFSSDESMTEAPAAVIHSRALSEAILESIIGKHGVSPAARRSIGTRMPEMLKKMKKGDEMVVVSPAAAVSAKPAVAIAECNGKSVEV